MKNDAPQMDMKAAAQGMLGGEAARKPSNLASAVEALFNAKSTAERTDAFRRAVQACDEECEAEEPEEGGMP